jgi:transcriptional regulator with XRE-family HTH domain
MSIIRTLAEARTKAGLSQADLAERIGTQQSVVGRFESEKTDPRLSSILKYAHALDLDLEIGPLPKPEKKGLRKKAVA